MKKCSACSKPSVYHITILEEGEVRELHFCENHFHEYMNNPSEVLTSEDEESAELFGGIDVDVDLTEEEEELVCPNCGMTFREFREQGRFGCPQDYIVFEKRLIPLLENIHNDTEHVGKAPKRAPHSSQAQFELIRLRRDLAVAVEDEDYERAAQLRDEIREKESEISAG